MAIRTLLLAVPVLTAIPSLLVAGIGYHRLDEPSWKSAAASLKARPDLAALPRGATRSLPALFYWGGVDFSISIGHLERWGEHGDRGASDPLAGAYGTSAPGAPDMYAGVPVLPSPGDIRAHFPDVPAILVALEPVSIANKMIDPVLLATLDEEGEELCRGGCGSLRLYLWRPRQAGLEAGGADPQYRAPGG
jgi:hypothetical protein